MTTVAGTQGTIPVNVLHLEGPGQIVIVVGDEPVLGSAQFRLQSARVDGNWGSAPDVLIRSLTSDMAVIVPTGLGSTDVIFTVPAGIAPHSPVVIDIGVGYADTPPADFNEDPLWDITATVSTSGATSSGRWANAINRITSGVPVHGLEA
ncbi:hypothetical protein SCB71_15680 [Herbiconiux sp. KACC 21604]|uniref:hypothetical protein n=1 Tax=unclassified Herbiconiux TaxID=2618217 RepID=UPI00149290B6|nr:hypothetical protein [Herbiconiux sp. SALV-R1]QJU54563.1 hypothetical protein HL652_13625 [Herbiconiux sp. SALV-R1]WPO85648.1 hypothetical protein SCB71_15680 [Herbiconiux sp. KACC 21604]